MIESLYKSVWSRFLKMIQYVFILMVYLSKGFSDNIDISGQNHLKIVNTGDRVDFTCMFPRVTRLSVGWIKVRVGEKPRLIASINRALTLMVENDFKNLARFTVVKDDGSFNLSILNIEESDTATYYCFKFNFKLTFEEGTDLIVKAGFQKPVIDPVEQEDSAVAMQCTILTQSCAGDQNVYWFRHESEESPPGIIYTQERRKGQCIMSFNDNSTAQKCIYNLPKNKVSHYDDGIYYCAVASCGEILFGDGRKADLHITDTFKGFQTLWSTITLVLATLNSLSVIVIMFLSTVLYKQKQKGIHNTPPGQLMNENTDALNYTSISFRPEPSTSKMSRRTNSQDNNSIYTHVSMAAGSGGAAGAAGAAAPPVGEREIFKNV
nr:uncharacterized protein LOC129437760 isoform X2 [Misgurnus anguillicaudatus]